MSVPSNDHQPTSSDHAEPDKRTDDAREPDYVQQATLVGDEDPAVAENELNGRSEKDFDGGVVEEVESSGREDDVDKEKLAARSTLKRSDTQQTQATGTTSISEWSQQSSEAPQQRKWYQRLNPLKSKYVPPVPKSREQSREYKAGFLSRLYFQWINPLMVVGYQRPLELNDIWLVNPDRSVYKLQQELYVNLDKRRKRKSDNALLMALYDTFKAEFLLGGFCALLFAVFQILSPFTVKYLIQFAGQAYYAANFGTPAPNLADGFGLVIGITAMQVFSSTAANHFIYRGMMVGGQSRAVLIGLIFDKAMTISNRAKAGGKSISEDMKGIKPGTEEEKSFFARKLARKIKPDLGKGISGDGVGWSNGRIVNLMSTDTYRVDQANGMFHIAWTSIVQICLTLVLLCVNLQASALSGFALIVICVPALTRAIRVLMRRRKYINKITDQRVSLTQEILASVRFVKYFGWEMSFLKRLDNIRTQEVNKIAFLLSIRNAIMAVGMSMPIFASMLAFVTYAKTQNVLNPAPIFSSLALFNSLRIPLNLLPTVIGQVVDGGASIKRIEEFLDAEDVADDATWDQEAKDAITVDRADFTWERTPTQDDSLAASSSGKGAKAKQHNKQSKAEGEGEKKIYTQSSEASVSPDTSSSDSVAEQKHAFEIKDINVSIGRNELVAVIGTVGSGKSSLLGALAGDMRKTKGSVTFGSTRAFCPQYAWIQNATLKENIVFGQDFHHRWYDQVVDACALRPDLEMLPNGDLTEIGERGITVSGGQKQRLNIARAIYFNADIVLMDDPLSAVDAHVGRHIMDHAICGLLKDKARVLATHQLHVLHRVDRIIWMKEGYIHKIATFSDLMNNDDEFQKLMETTAVEQQENSDEADEADAEVQTAVDKKRRKKGPALMQVEDRAVNGTGWKTYTAYVKASGSYWVAPLVIGMLILGQGANIVNGLWLSWWTANRWGFTTNQYIGIYAALGFVQALLMFTFSVSLTIFGTRASKAMLHKAITRVLRAPMSFFDTTPLGRITNRFGKDVDTMDNVLTDSMRMFTMTMAMIISVFILIISYYHYFAIALGPLMVMFVVSANFYRASARELKRHEAVLRSDVYSRFGEAISGTATIRAYGLQKQFARSVNDAVDAMDGAYFLTFANQRWLSIRLDLIGNLLVFTTGVLVVTARFSIDPSTGGLILSYILAIVQLIQFTVRQLAEVENNMNSTERIHYYGTQLEEEAPLHIGNVRPTWPEHGEIEFDHVEMRYRAGLPLVLKGLSMHVKAGERVGIVGRTGAGKSSIMSTLFRLVELSGGRIVIDGVDIATIGLNDLRSKLAIIPQDPTLFRGTIRSNLDPFNEHSDLDLWNALRQADLVGADQKMDDSTGHLQLDTQVEDEGLNFSLGQRQLLALARALVRGSQIIVCDEATSSVDFETDQKIQRTIVRGFRGKTLLCIAHRLKTIIGYDRILVMDAGNVAELDTPIKLYDAGGIFRSMCDRSGIRREDFFNSEEANFGHESPALERDQEKTSG